VSDDADSAVFLTVDRTALRFTAVPPETVGARRSAPRSAPIRAAKRAEVGMASIGCVAVQEITRAGNCGKKESGEAAESELRIAGEFGVGDSDVEPNSRTIQQDAA
jgi:hypothetical protein